MRLGVSAPVHIGAIAEIACNSERTAPKLHAISCAVQISAIHFVWLNSHRIRTKHAHDPFFYPQQNRIA